MCYKSRKTRDVPMVQISEDSNRVKRSKILLNWIKRGSNGKKIRIFSDEKLFIIDRVVNRQNDRYWTTLSVKYVEPDLINNRISKHSA